MLKITTDLIDRLEQSNLSSDIINSYVNSIMRFGTKNDSDHLLPFFLKDPFNFRFSYLIPLFKKFGDKSYAEKIVEIYNNNPKEVEESRSEILELLGDLKYEPIKDILKQYAFGTGDFYLCKSSVLGLLNFDCKEYQTQIKSEIIKCYGQPLFSEYVPALVCKIDEQEKILEELFVLGSEHASTDCNAGIVLGFSLCGEIGKKYFIDALKDPNWEVDSSGTGTRWVTYVGIKNLKVTFQELYLMIPKEGSVREIEHLLSVLFSMLELRARDYDDAELESFTELYSMFFTWKDENEESNLIDLARKYEMSEQAYAIRGILQLKMTEELMLSVQ